MVLSIIIPVFNVEPFIKKCILSCLHQNIEDYEIIVINDGTTDSSMKIVEELALENESVRIFEQENQGLSATRNRGISLAKGKYIWFVDSDDWIEENCLKDIVASMEKEQCDVLCQTQMFKEGVWHKSSNYFVPNNVNTLSEYFWSESPNPAQFYVFKKSFILENNLYFKVGIKHEDSLFTPIMLCLAQRLSFYRKPIYHFYKRANSITTIYDPKRSDDYCYIVDRLYNFYTEIEDSNIKDAFAHRICSIIKAHVYLGTFLSKSVQASINIFYKYNKKYIYLLKKDRKLSSKILYFINSYTPLSIVSIYKIASFIKY